MGTDIHLEVERRAGDGWQYVPHVERDCWSCALDAERASKDAGKPVPVSFKKDCFWCHGTGRHREQFYHDRSYSVFAILAGVRNGVGFAGCDTGDPFVPISEPRGLPADMSFELRRRLKADYDDDDDWVSLGDHSFSWLTLDEVLAYDWDQTTKKRGWVDAWNFELFRRNGKPDSWSGGIGGPGIEHVSNAHVARLIDSGDIRWDDRPATVFEGRGYTTAWSRGPGLAAEKLVEAALVAPKRYYTNVEWEVTYRDCAEHFLEIIHRDLVSLGDPKGTRLVFGFDS